MFGVIPCGDPRRVSCEQLCWRFRVAVTLIASNVTRTQASPLANPSVLSGAIDELAVVDNVHCRPGWAHHTPTRWRRANGCLRDRGGVVVVPGRTRYRDGVRVRVGG